MSDIFDQISSDLNSALKARDETAVSTLRFLISGLKNAKIARGRELTDEEVIGQIATQAKSHRESIEAFKAGGRDDLVEKEQAQLSILQKYLPEQIGEEELEKIVEEVISEVKASGFGDMGKVMGAVISKAKGRAEGGRVAAVVKKKLSE